MNTCVMQTQFNYYIIRFIIKLVCLYVLKTFLKKINFYFIFFILNLFLVFSDHFDMLILKIIFLNKINIIFIHLQIKNTLKNNRCYKISLISC